MILRAILIILICLFPAVAFSTPPTALVVTYDKVGQSLHVEMQHITKNPRKHRIRRIVVEKNHVTVEDKILTTQTSNTDVSADFPLTAKKGDVISVKATCSEAGSADKTITVE